MKQAFINFCTEQLQNNYLLRQPYTEGLMQYNCLNQSCNFSAEYKSGKFVVTTPHTCLKQTSAAETNPLLEGERVLLTFSFDELYNVQLQHGNKFECRYGLFQHSDIIGKPAGVKIYNSQGTGFTIALRFNPTLNTESLKRLTQIIFTPDISLIIGRVNIKPGWNVTEAGIGSGSLSHALIQAIQPYGSLHNYDIVEQRVKQCQEQFDQYFPGICVSQYVNVLEEGFKGVEDESQQLVFLDFPGPEKCLNDVTRILEDAGHFVVFLPCIEQLHQLISEMYRDSKFYNIEVVKMHYNSYEYDSRIMSPQAIVKGKNLTDLKKIKSFLKNSLARTHTGYLIFSRKSTQVQRQQQ